MKFCDVCRAKKGECDCYEFGRHTIEELKEKKRQNKKLKIGH
jgi:hypothetical protein